MSVDRCCRCAHRPVVPGNRCEPEALVSDRVYYYLYCPKFCDELFIDINVLFFKTSIK